MRSEGSHEVQANQAVSGEGGDPCWYHAFGGKTLSLLAQADTNDLRHPYRGTQAIVPSRKARRWRIARRVIFRLGVIRQASVS